MTETQEVRSWERSSPPYKVGDEVVETPCPRLRPQHHESTYKKVMKDLATIRDKLAAADALNEHNII